MVVKKQTFHLRYFVDDESVNTLQRIERIRETLLDNIVTPVKIDVENCYHLIVEADSEGAFESQYSEQLCWLLCKNVFDKELRRQSKFLNSTEVIEIGPRLSFTTAFSTNAVSACKAAGINGVKRLEISKRYLISCGNKKFNWEKILPLIHDSMTECEYGAQTSFDKFRSPEKYYQIDVITSKDNLKNASKMLGLGFDEDDVDYYYNLFANELKRNPTDVELFDLAQSNTKHNRHTFFKGKLFIDGKERKDSLFKSIQDMQKYSNPNNVIAFSDNSSAISGFKTHCLKSFNPTVFSEMDFLPCERHIVYSAEIHNFSNAVSPFLKAATSTGGRIRNVHATGRGAHEIAGITGYLVGNLNLKGYRMQWEELFEYPSNMAYSQNILIETSNGASDYGNKFGEPVIAGFVRSFGQKLSSGERCEYVNPIIFSGGIGSIDDIQVKKLLPKAGAWLVKIGGPAYRNGVGGGTANSVDIQGQKSRVTSLDYGAVQHGDPEMEQKLHRVIRGCIELGDRNPIMSIHDQGAGGNGNVLKKLIGNHCGAIIEANKFQLGDSTLSIRELWCTECQENDAAIIDPECAKTLELLAKREKCNVSFIGRLNDTQTVTLLDYDGKHSSTPPFNLPSALAERCPKQFRLKSVKDVLVPLTISSELTVMEALSLVLRLPSVASKRYLTNKVDRSVTGLVALQQCVGPLETPLADVGVVALSHWDTVGGAVAVGEQPIKGLISPEAGARMSLAEALTNLVFAPITERKDIKCSGNWMWAAKVNGKGARLTRACDALCEAMKKVGVAIDGGKDSLSMTAQVRDEVVKAPETIVISAYAPCVDITKVVTPDLKGSLDDTPTRLIYIRFGNDGFTNRLGGSALAQCLKQIGDSPSDIDDYDRFARAFDIVQKLIKEERILSGHDVSDGGLITCALEMAIAGNRTTVLQIMSPSGVLDTLFAEESGIIIEVEDKETEDIKSTFRNANILAEEIGFVTNDTDEDAMVIIKMNFSDILSQPLSKIRDMWEDTSNQLEVLQTNPKCAAEQKLWLSEAKTPIYKAEFDYSSRRINFKAQKMLKMYSVAVLREEGSNGDREMAAAFYLAGFTVFDVTMEDFLDSHFSLSPFNGIAFVGGFSYGDVLGAAKGWSSLIKHHEKVLKELENFRNRSDTFSLGVCNGCQLVTLLGWVGSTNGDQSTSVQLKQNDCGRFQSSFSSVAITKSPSIFLAGMEGSVLGIWSAHGEGKFCFNDEKVLDELERNCLIPVRYCDTKGEPTMNFPQNPNGSPRAVAAITSADGRHLAIMPHPERSFLSWQWPYYPRNWKKDHFNASPWEENYDYTNSPWMRMFTNAYEWTHLKT